MPRKDNSQGAPLINETDPLLPAKGLVEDVNRLGFRISPSWFEKLCADGKGPEPDGYWGRSPLWKRSTGRAWVEQRLRARKAA